MDNPPTSAAERSSTGDGLIGALLGDLVHRLNNPLTSLSANLDFLSQRAPGDEDADAPDGEEALVMDECRAAISELVALAGALGGWERASADEATVEAHGAWQVPAAIAALAGRYHGALMLPPSSVEEVPFVTHPAALHRALLALILLAMERPVAYGEIRLTVEVTPAEIRFGVEDVRSTSPAAEGLRRPWPQPLERCVREAVATLGGRWDPSGPVAPRRDLVALPRR